VGALAIPLWSTWPALALWSLEMPAFECLTIAFGIGWITLTLLDRPSRVPPIAHGCDALRDIAPQIVATGAVLRLFRLRVRQIIGLGLGFAGTAILLVGGKLSLSGTGVALALLSGLSWAAARCPWTSVAQLGPAGRRCGHRDGRSPVAHRSLALYRLPQLNTGEPQLLPARNLGVRRELLR
jgi:hypothetical protein